MALPLAALAALGAVGSAGLTAGGNLLNTGVNILGNKWLQEDSQDFNANEALKQRNFESYEAQIARDWQTNANKIAMDFNASEAQKARDYDMYMSNTQVQRRLDDLKKAGINPILAATDGASTPSGQSASIGPSNGASARGQSATSGATSFRATMDNIAENFFNTLHTARKIEKTIDDIQHQRTMREIEQRHQLVREGHLSQREFEFDMRNHVF